MKLKIIKMYDDVKTPVYATKGSACFDIFAHTITRVDDNSVEYSTGLKVEIPVGYKMNIYSRSGHGFKRGIRLANGTGIIDSDYRGEICVKLTCDNSEVNLARFPVHGDAIAQGELVPIEQVEFEEVGELSDTERGEGGFGSTDNKVGEQV